MIRMNRNGCFGSDARHRHPLHNSALEVMALTLRIHFPKIEFLFSRPAVVTTNCPWGCYLTVWIFFFTFLEDTNLLKSKAI